MYSRHALLKYIWKIVYTAFCHGFVRQCMLVLGGSEAMPKDMCKWMREFTMD